MHQTWNTLRILDVAVKVDALNKGRSAITNSDDRDSNFSAGQVFPSFQQSRRNISSTSFIVTGVKPPKCGFRMAVAGINGLSI